MTGEVRGGEQSSKAAAAAIAAVTEQQSNSSLKSCSNNSSSAASKAAVVEQQYQKQQQSSFFLFDFFASIVVHKQAGGSFLFRVHVFTENLNIPITVQSFSVKATRPLKKLRIWTWDELLKWNLVLSFQCTSLPDQRSDDVSFPHHGSPVQRCLVTLHKHNTQIHKQVMYAGLVSCTDCYSLTAVCVMELLSLIWCTFFILKNVTYVHLAHHLCGHTTDRQ